MKKITLYSFLTLFALSILSFISKKNPAEKSNYWCGLYINTTNSCFTPGGQTTLSLVLYAETDWDLGNTTYKWEEWTGSHWDSVGNMPTYTITSMAGSQKTYQCKAVNHTPNMGAVAGVEFLSPPITITKCVLTPVSLTGFTVSRSNIGAEITWTTLQEINTKYFILERSTDGVNFKDIVKVDANGNSAQKINYRLVDITAETFSNYYYRLRIVDINGKMGYGNIGFLKSGTGIGFTSGPNPTSGIFQIHTNDVNAKSSIIELYNSDGRLVGKKQFSNTVDMTAYPSGYYYLRVVNNGDVLYKATVLKN